MKTVCIMDSVSRANGGIFEAERHFQRHLQASAALDVRVVGLEDKHTAADLEAWKPLVPQTLRVKGPSAFGYAPGLISTLENLDADLGYLVGLWKYPSVATARWSVAGRKPVMVAPHGMLEFWALKNSGIKKRVAGWLFQNALLRRAACLRALTTAEAQSMRAYGLKNPICVIPNGIDLPPEMPQTVRPAPWPSDRKVLLYLGRLHPKKGLVPLLKAWKEVQPLTGAWILAIAGWDQGGHEAELNRLATELGLAWVGHGDRNSDGATIFFLGPQFDDAKEACYRSCDAFVLPSFSEGLPMVVLEAWAHGKPVWMTSACNLPEGFAAQAAFPMAPTVENMAEALAALVACPDSELRAMGTRGRALVQERFDWRKQATIMASVYGWMLGGGVKPGCVECS